MPERPERSKAITRRMFSTASITTLGVAGAIGGENAAAQERPKVAEIPPLKYDLEAQTHWTGEGGSAKEATAEEFPVSQSIAGVSMRLDAGAIRELHWHALAAEWAYVLEGRVRATVIAPNGQSEISEFAPGDTWYFPRGHGHALQALGPGPAHFLLVFDNGHFSEFGTFSVTDWIAQTRPEIAGRILNLSPAELAKMPKKELYIGPGKIPVAPIEDLRNPDLQPMQFSHKYRLDQAPGKVFDGGTEHIIAMKEFPIQTTLTAVKMDLKPGGLREMHWHPHADEWQYYVKGRARMTVFGSHGRTRTEEFGPGHVGFVPQGYGHYIEQVGNEPTQILILFNHPEFQEISISGWFGGNPNSLLSTNLGLSDEAIAKLPKKEQGILGRKA